MKYSKVTEKVLIFSGRLKAEKLGAGQRKRPGTCGIPRLPMARRTLFRAVEWVKTLSEFVRRGLDGTTCHPFYGDSPPVFEEPPSVCTR